MINMIGTSCELIGSARRATKLIPISSSSCCSVLTASSLNGQRTARPVAWHVPGIVHTLLKIPQNFATCKCCVNVGSELCQHEFSLSTVIPIRHKLVFLLYLSPRNFRLNSTSMYLSSRMTGNHVFTFSQPFQRDVKTKAEVKVKIELDRGTHVESSPQRQVDLATVVSLLYCHAKSCN